MMYGAFSHAAKRIIKKAFEEKTIEEKNKLTSQWEAEGTMPEAFAQTVRPLIEEELNNIRTQLEQELAYQEAQARLDIHKLDPHEQSNIKGMAHQLYGCNPSEAQYVMATTQYRNYKLASANQNIQGYDKLVKESLDNLAYVEMPKSLKANQAM